MNIHDIRTVNFVTPKSALDKNLKVFQSEFILNIANKRSRKVLSNCLQWKCQLLEETRLANQFLVKL